MYVFCSSCQVIHGFHDIDISALVTAFLNSNIIEALEVQLLESCLYAHHPLNFRPTALPLSRRAGFRCTSTRRRNGGVGRIGTGPGVLCLHGLFFDALEVPSSWTFPSAHLRHYVADHVDFATKRESGLESHEHRLHGVQL